jgi:hypothetical protein
MSLFAIADLHLSLGTDKPMDIFSGWSDYVSRITKNWKAIVNDDDTVVIAGDISWAMKLTDTYKDFEYINSLPGRKIILKGNHDYWWETMNKMNNYISDNHFDSLNILFNNSYECGDYAICGTRGWLLDSNKEEDKLVLSRELGRLKASLDSAVKFGKEPVVFLHYPPVYGNFESEGFIPLMQEYGVKKCFYGHIHGANMIRNSLNDEYKGINFKLISCDGLSFVPLLVR